MTPDLVAEFETAMRDLEEMQHVLDQLAPAYLRELITIGADRRRVHAPARPKGMPPLLAKAIREIADDALVRAAARTPAGLHHPTRSTTPMTRSTHV